MSKEKESDLVSAELLKWESGLEKPDMYQKIRESNTRYNAMSCLNQLLKEQWALLISRDSVNGVDEQEEENETGVGNDGDMTVALNFKDWLLGIEGVVGPDDFCTMTGQETNNVMDLSIAVTPQPDRSEFGGKYRRVTSSRRVRTYLPAPEPLNVQPLKTVKSAKPRARRPVRFWTDEEVEALREGVKGYGKAWKAIKDSNPLAFANRTEVDLKDKWRNLLCHH